MKDPITLCVFDCTTLATLVRDLNAYCHIPLTAKFVIGLRSKELKLTKKMKATKIYKLTSTLSLDRRGFDQSSFIMLFMVSSGWLSLFTEHHVGPGGTRILSIIVKYGKNSYYIENSISDYWKLTANLIVNDIDKPYIVVVFAS